MYSSNTICAACQVAYGTHPKFAPTFPKVIYENCYEKAISLIDCLDIWYANGGVHAYTKFDNNLMNIYSVRGDYKLILYHGNSVDGLGECLHGMYHHNTNLLSFK